MTRWLALTMFLVTLGVAAPAMADDLDDCKQEPNPDLRLRACADLIEAGRVTGENLAIAYVNRGIAYYDKGQYDRALASYNRAIEIDPDDAIAYNNRGNTAYAKGEFDRAIADYGRAIQLDPDTAGAYSNRGLAYGAKGDTDRAIADYNKAITFDPDLSSAYANRGSAFRAGGDINRAIADYDRAIELDPETVSTYRDRGLAHFGIGDFERAALDLKRSADSGDVYGVLWLFMAQSRAGVDAAVALKANAANLESKDWPYPVIELYLGKQSADEILPKAETANELCEASFYIGEWHLIEGRKEKAIPILRSAVETCPKNFIEYSGAVAELAGIE